MKREEIIDICANDVLVSASDLFGMRTGDLKQFSGYEGAANLVYEYEVGGRPLILRVSYTPERSLEQIRAELHFVNYLADHGVRVSRPVPSQNGNLVETIAAGECRFILLVLSKGRACACRIMGIAIAVMRLSRNTFRTGGRF